MYWKSIFFMLYLLYMDWVWAAPLSRTRIVDLVR